MDYDEILQILKANEKLNFVQRVLNPKEYPTLPRPDLGEGISSTHVMSYATDDKGAFVYPQVIQDPNTNELKMLKPREAMDYAIKNNQFIRFDNPDKANAFSTEYKKYWNVQNQLKDMQGAVK